MICEKRKQICAVFFFSFVCFKIVSFILRLTLTSQFHTVHGSNARLVKMALAFEGCSKSFLSAIIIYFSRVIPPFHRKQCSNVEWDNSTYCFSFIAITSTLFICRDITALPLLPLYLPRVSHLRGCWFEGWQINKKA